MCDHNHSINQAFRATSEANILASTVTLRTSIPVNQAAHTQCNQCPFRTDSELFNKYVPGADVGVTPEIFVQLVQQETMKHSTPFSCHKRPQQHCAGAQKIQGTWQGPAEDFTHKYMSIKH